MLVLATVLTIAPTEVHAASPFARGSGTEADPYLIQDAEQLNAVRTVTDEVYHFKLIDNIDLTSYLAEGGPGHNSGAGWEPIGDRSSLFYGTFDGDGHTISGLTINRPNTNQIGLFGYIASSSTIKNVKLVDIEVLGQYSVGGLVGYNDGGSIVNSSATGVVSGNDNVGGLVELDLTKITVSGDVNHFTMMAQSSQTLMRRELKPFRSLLEH